MPHSNCHVRRTDQAAKLREMVCRQRHGAVTIALASGKGGVGKSNIAVNLSVALARIGLRVTLVDADMGLANADLLLNIQPRYTLSHVLLGVKSLEEVSVEGPGGIRLIPGASGVQRVADLSEFERQNLISQFHKLAASTDIIVLDCGAGIGRNVISFASAADCVSIVTTPQPTALTDAYAIIKTLHAEGYAGRLSLLVNMVKTRAEAQEAYRRVAGVAKRFLNYIVAESGYVLQDNAVELAVRQRQPFVLRYPNSNASACITAIANDLARSFADRSVADNRGGLLRRVAGLFL